MFFKLLSLSLLLIIFLSFPNLVLSHGAGVHIHMTDQGYEPKSVVIFKGEKILFENESTKSYWPIVSFPLSKGPQIYDSQREIKPGESWLFKFDLEGNWQYTDKLNPQVLGQITVTVGSGPPTHDQDYITPKKTSFLDNLATWFKGFFKIKL